MKVAPPIDHTVVHLVRHGEVNNPEGVLYGRLPGYHLSDNGCAMAQRLAEHFAGTNLTALRSSPLERARQTLEPIAGRHPHLEVQVDDLAIEAGNDFEGQVFGAANAALKRPANWWKMRNPLKPSWGESYKEIAARMRRAVLAAAEAAGEGGEAVLVSHQLPIWIARLDAEGRLLAHDPRKRQCNLGSVTSMHLRGTRLVRIEYAEPCADLIKPRDRGKAFSSGS